MKRDKKPEAVVTMAASDSPRNPVYPLISKDWETPANEGLHQLNVSRAVEHLRVLRAAQEDLEAFSNINLMDIGVHLEEDVQKLVLGNPAYRDAAALLFAGIRAK